MDAVQQRVDASAKLLTSLAGAKVSEGSVNDVQPASLRPLLGDACVTKYASPVTGNAFTYVFSSSVAEQAIADAARADGYEGGPGTFASMYLKTTPGIKAPATVTVAPTSADKDFSGFYPTGFSIQTVTPVGAR